MQRTTVVVDKASDGHCICLRSRRLITYYPTTNELMDLATALAPYGICRGERSLCCDAEMDDLFKKALAAFQAETAKLAGLARAGNADAIKAQIPAVGKTCGGCHDDFRVKR